jgi:hypothetical protein
VDGELGGGHALAPGGGGGGGVVEGEGAHGQMLCRLPV